MTRLWPAHYSPPRRSSARIMEAVSRASGLLPSELRGPRRDSIALAGRAVAYSELRRAGVAKSTIARMFGRDKTCVRQGLAKFDHYRAKFPMLAAVSL